jgi:hypothetical protein
MTTLHDILLDLGKHHVSVRYDGDEIIEVYILFPGPGFDRKEISVDITELALYDDKIERQLWSAIRAEQQAHAEAVRDARADR